MEISTIISIIGVLVPLTNVIVQVLKKVTWDKLPTNILAWIIAELLTIAAGIAYFQIKHYELVWYFIVAFIIVGFMVAFAAMFGFDKLREIMHWKESE